jgi:DUF971 family protein
MSQDPQVAAPVPTEFAYDEGARALVVGWRGGSETRIPFPELRRACPCATCKGELGTPGRFEMDPQLHPGEDELADIALVGNYGLKVVWADGHDTGIYRFELLTGLGTTKIE